MPKPFLNTKDKVFLTITSIFMSAGMVTLCMVDHPKFKHPSISSELLELSITCRLLGHTPGPHHRHG